MYACRYSICSTVFGCGIENINRFNPECGINGVPKCIAMNGTEEIIKKIKEGLKK